ncbi:hypothetical protein MVEN_01879100 [Mycena venus]|uniref:Uncharacterized protein n=1 Tax=Mycena venus TaxID=2733690 RepID=A0A8H6XJ21_9AGAR|nr:hypothetical protein MVEN_01879100 [Mycena venus]
MAPDSKFNAQQREHMESYYAEWYEVYTNKQDKNGLSPAKWKNQTADTILKSPLFYNQLPTAEDPVKGTTPEKWKQRLMEIFKNKATQDNLKGNKRSSKAHAGSGSHGPGGEVSLLASVKSFFTRPTLIGQRLLEIKEKEMIMQDANAWAKKAKEKVMKDANAQVDLVEETEEKEKIMKDTLARVKIILRAIQFYGPAAKAAWDALSP